MHMSGQATRPWHLSLTASPWASRVHLSSHRHGEQGRPQASAGSSAPIPPIFPYSRNRASLSQNAGKLGKGKACHRRDMGRLSPKQGHTLLMQKCGGERGPSGAARGACFSCKPTQRLHLSLSKSPAPPGQGLALTAAGLGEGPRRRAQDLGVRRPCLPGKQARVAQTQVVPGSEPRMFPLHQQTWLTCPHWAQYLQGRDRYPGSTSVGEKGQEEPLRFREAG